MADDKNKYDKAYVGNRLSEIGITKKVIYSTGAIFVCVFFIIVLSVTQAIYDVSVIGTIEFWIEFAILSALSIFGMISGKNIGDDISRNNRNGNFRKSVLPHYVEIVDKIKSNMLVAYLDSWLDLLRKRKTDDKIKDILVTNGINQSEVLKLGISELDNLLKPYKKEFPNGETFIFEELTKEQIEIIRYVKSGKVTIAKLPKSFFLNALNLSEKDMWESASNQSKKKTLYVAFNYGFRIFSLLAVCVVTSGLTPGKSGDNAGAVIWLSLTKRIFTMIIGCLCGFFIGCGETKIDGEYIDYKTEILEQYYDEIQLKIFVPKTINEIAKEKYNEYVKEHPTVEPEIVLFGFKDIKEIGVNRL